MKTYLIHRKFQEVSSLLAQKKALSFQQEDEFFSLTFQDVFNFALKVNAFLRRENFRFSDRAVLYMENNPFWFSAYLGIVSLGGVCVPLDCQAGVQELASILEDSEARIVFCSQDTFEKLKNLSLSLHNFKIVILNKRFFEEYKDLEAEFLDFSEESIASLVYTSGTSDNPKAVMLSHKNFMSNFYSIWSLGFYTSRDCFLCILPLHHTYPFTVNLLSSLLSGAEVVFPQSLRAEDILYSLKKKKVTILIGVPQLFSLLNQNFEKRLGLFKSLIYFSAFFRERFNLNLGKIIFFFLHRAFSPYLKFMVCGGAKLEEVVGRSLFGLGFNILEGYGLTEASPVVSFNPPAKIKIGSVGKPLPGIEVKTDSSDGVSVGELMVKGDNVAKGYFRKPALTRQIFRDGWLYTRDIGYIDKEGYIYISGRKDECIVLSSGKNVWPQELESFYEELDSIEEVGIFNRGDSLYAVVVPRKEVFSGKDREEILTRIKQDIQDASLKLAPYKRISGFSLSFKNLPRTRLGKLRRFLLPRIFEETQKGKEDDFKLDDFSCQVIEAVKHFAVGEVKLDDYLSDIGIDSLSKIQLTYFLEKRFGTKINDDDLFNIVKVRDILNYLKKKGVSSWQDEEFSGEWSQVFREEVSLRFSKKVRLKPKFLDIFFSLMAKGLLFILFKALYRLKIVGIDNLPEEGPFLLCPNHNSYLDGLVVFCSFPSSRIKELYFLGLSDYFEHPLLSWLVKPARIIPIDAEKNLRDALKISAFLIKNKKILCVFPEGSRSWDGELKEFKKGVGILAQELGVKLVPVGIKGTFEAWPAFKRFPRLGSVPLKIIYAPFIQSDFVESKDNYSYKRITNLLRERINKLLAET